MGNLMNSESFVEMDALLESLCQNHDIGFFVIGKDMVAWAFDILMILKEEVLELKVVDIKGWRHPLLNILGLNVYMYP